MITKFDKFNESILPEPIQMDYDENDKVRLNADEIEIDDEFENELSDRKAWKLKDISLSKPFDDKELIKLNLHFGIHIPKLHDSSEYNFKGEYGNFGQPKTIIKGKICKKIEIEEKPVRYKNTYYLIDMFMTVKAGSSKG